MVGVAVPKGSHSNRVFVSIVYISMRNANGSVARVIEGVTHILDEIYTAHISAVFNVFPYFSLDNAI